MASVVNSVTPIPSSVLNALRAAKSDRKFTLLSWSCRVAARVRLTDLLFERMLESGAENFSALRKAYKREQLETLADQKDPLDACLFHALYIAPQCQGHSAATDWKLIEAIKVEKKIEIPNPSKEIWESNRSFLAARKEFEAHKELLKPAEEDMGEVQGARAETKRPNKRARAPPEEPKHTGDADLMGECPSTCLSDRLLRIIFSTKGETGRLKELSQKFNSISKLDKERYDVKFDEVKPMEEELNALEQPLGDECSLQGDQITGMEFDNYRGADQEEVDKLIEACTEAQLKALAAIDEVEKKREEYRSFVEDTQQQRAGCEKALEEAEEDLYEEDEQFKKAKDEVSSQLDIALEKLESRTKASFHKVKAKKSLCVVELPLKKKGAELRALEDKALEAKKALLQNIGDLNLVAKVQAPTPLVPSGEEPLPQEVDALQQLVIALKEQIKEQEAAMVKAVNEAQTYKEKYHKWKEQAKSKSKSKSKSTKSKHHKPNPPEPSSQGKSQGSHDQDARIGSQDQDSHSE